MDGVHNNNCLQIVWVWILVSWLSVLCEQNYQNECMWLSWSIVFIKQTKHQSYLLCSQRVTSYSLKWLRHDSFNIREQCSKKTDYFIISLSMVCGHHSYFKQFNREIKMEDFPCSFIADLEKLQLHHSVMYDSSMKVWYSCLPPFHVRRLIWFDISIEVKFKWYLVKL